MVPALIIYLGLVMQIADLVTDIHIVLDFLFYAVAGLLWIPLAGKVVSLTVQVGQEVKVGDEIMVLEAMKMNTQVHAANSGRIIALSVQPCDQVEEGQALVTMDS